jgi:hypothetical protein
MKCGIQMESRGATTSRKPVENILKWDHWQNAAAVAALIAALTAPAMMP